MAKSRDAFRTISEVSDWLDTPAHVLRFWESKFAQVKPVKRAGGRRYYRPQDMALLGGIKTLLHDQGMTIKGAQKLIREEGVKHVAALGPDPSGTGKPMVDVTPKPKKTKAKPAPAVEADPNDPWPADPAPVEDATKATPVETIADEPATKPKSTRTIPALPDEAAAQERPGIAAIALAANAGLAGKNNAAIRPLLARLKAVRDNATAA